MFRDFFKRWRPKKEDTPGAAVAPPALRHYMSLRSKPNKSAALDSVRFVVFDTETSGLDFSKNRLLSIAGIAVRNLEVRMDDVFDTVVEQVDVGGAQAAVVHGLVSGDLVGGSSELDAASEFLAFAGDSVLVAHHAAFDVRMLQKAIASCPNAKVWSPAVDTAQLAKRVEVGPMSSSAAHGAEDREAYRLDQLVDRYGIEVPERQPATRSRPRCSSNASSRRPSGAASARSVTFCASVWLSRRFELFKSVVEVVDETLSARHRSAARDDAEIEAVVDARDRDVERLPMRHDGAYHYSCS